VWTLTATEKEAGLFEHYAKLIKSASSPSTKASYRKSKIDRATSHDRRIESIKRDIENAKNALKKCK
jgi:hypothetical protein